MLNKNNYEEHYKPLPEEKYEPSPEELYEHVQQPWLVSNETWDETSQQWQLVPWSDGHNRFFEENQIESHQEQNDIYDDQEYFIKEQNNNVEEKQKTQEDLNHQYQEKEQAETLEQEHQEDNNQDEQSYYSKFEQNENDKSSITLYLEPIIY